MQTTDWQLLANYFSGELSLQEQQQVLDWVENAPENRVAFEQAKRLWEASARELPVPNANTEAQWATLQKKMEVEYAASTSVKPLQPFFKPYYWAAAAVFLILIGIGFSYWKPEPATSTFVLASSAIRLHTTTDSLKALYLPDSSRVWLNQHSELSYTEAYGNTERRIKLKGQAFFEVKPNINRPFYVETDGTRTRVLGTSFDVTAYPDQPIVEVSVVTGKVAFYAVNDSLITGVTLYPQETGTFRKVEGLITKRKEPEPQQLVWRKVPRVVTNVQPEGKQAIAKALVRPEIKQPSRFLRVTSRWRKNAVNQTILEGSIQNTSNEVSYTTVKLRYRIFTKQGKQKLSYFTIREVIMPGKTISYKRNLLDVLTKSSQVNVEIAEVEVTNPTPEQLKKN